jgi:hypothetical protein
VNFRIPGGTTAGMATIQLSAAWIKGPTVQVGRNIRGQWPMLNGFQGDSVCRSTDGRAGSPVYSAAVATHFVAVDCPILTVGK